LIKEEDLVIPGSKVIEIKSFFKQITTDDRSRVLVISGKSGSSKWSTVKYFADQFHLKVITVGYLTKAQIPFLKKEMAQKSPDINFLSDSFFGFFALIAEAIRTSRNSTTFSDQPIICHQRSSANTRPERHQSGA